MPYHSCISEGKVQVLCVRMHTIVKGKQSYMTLKLMLPWRDHIVFPLIYLISVTGTSVVYANI